MFVSIPYLNILTLVYYKVDCWGQFSELCTATLELQTRGRYNC